jgi:hypothetical protein
VTPGFVTAVVLLAALTVAGMTGLISERWEDPALVAVVTGVVVLLGHAAATWLSGTG